MIVFFISNVTTQMNLFHNDLFFFNFFINIISLEISILITKNAIFLYFSMQNSK